MSQATTAPHPNALNARAGANHKQWHARGASQEGSAPHWLLSAARAPGAPKPTLALKTMRKGGSSSHLARGWGDKMIGEAAARVAGSLRATPAEASRRAFDIASRMLGLGRSERSEAAARPERGIGQYIACVELDGCPDTKAILAEIARAALRGKARATHLGLHAGYGPGNGYRGSHLVVDLDELLGAELRVESRMDARGASAHVFAEIGGERVDLVSVKRKGGDGPSERYADQLQATLLCRGAFRAGRALASSASLRDTGRSVHRHAPAASAAREPALA